MKGLGRAGAHQPPRKQLQGRSLPLNCPMTEAPRSPALSPSGGLPRELGPFCRQHQHCRPMTSQFCKVLSSKIRIRVSLIYKTSTTMSFTQHVLAQSFHVGNFIFQY